VLVHNLSAVLGMCCHQSVVLAPHNMLCVIFILPLSLQGVLQSSIILSMLLLHISCNCKSCRQNKIFIFAYCTITMIVCYQKGLCNIRIQFLHNLLVSYLQAAVYIIIICCADISV